MNEGLPLENDRYQWLTPAAAAAIAIFWCRCQCRLFDRDLPAEGEARFARLIDPAARPVDEVVVLRLPGELIEVQCHGGPGQRQRIDAALADHGLQPSEAELIDPLWDRMARIAHPAALPLVLGQHPLPSGFREEFCYRQPMVLIAGPANAGKSSLLNAWCGHARALVAEEAGTTRDLVWAEIETCAWRLRICDSAGHRDADDELEQAGQALVVSARARADLVIWLAPADQPGSSDQALAGDLLVIGKADLRDARSSGLCWADAQHIGEAASQDLLAKLEAAVLQRLGLPVNGA